MKRLMDALYRRDDRFYAFAFGDRNALIAQSAFKCADDCSVFQFIEVANSLRMAVAISVGVFEPETPDRPAQRTEDQCLGLSAFGIDIDTKNFDALVAGATTVDEVIPEVLRRLGQF